LTPQTPNTKLGMKSKRQHQPGNTREDPPTKQSAMSSSGPTQFRSDPTKQKHKNTQITQKKKKNQTTKYALGNEPPRAEKKQRREPRPVKRLNT